MSRAATESKRQAFADSAERRDGDEESDRVAKLLGERDTLLQTGVYTNDDPVIAELDREIRHLIAVSST